MDEADILGDRIAIISHGKLCCCGSSLFLKKCFGSGYYLTLVCARVERNLTQHRTLPQSQTVENSVPEGNVWRNDGVDEEDADEGVRNQSTGSADLSGCVSGVNAITRLLQRHVPGSVFLECIGQEVTYILPYAAAHDGSFALLLKELDLEMGNLGVASYGVSDTTLEEIFLKVAEDTGVDVEKADMEKAGRASGKGSYVIGGWRLIRRQFMALIIKRFHYARRSRKGLIAQVVLPAVFVCLSLIFSLIVPPFLEYPSLELQPWMYGVPQNTFFSDDAPGHVEAARVVDSLVNRPGFGTRCMAQNPLPKLPCASNGSDWFTPSVPPSVSDIFANGNWTMACPSPSCQCSTPSRTTILPDCPLGAGGLPPPQLCPLAVSCLNKLMETTLVSSLTPSSPITTGYHRAASFSRIPRFPIFPRLRTACPVERSKDEASAPSYAGNFRRRPPK
ncbi:hypothetical protein Z043_109458 [Scleropages formosus]|uniref:ABC transporter domain-containing protein n=1 Tax=Scleropages formosus TaxID=113540 RepID=A0A0P7VE55_SCLFO|nr:hypothetical protein Z043_109458 [Scleropages formosus]